MSSKYMKYRIGYSDEPELTISINGRRYVNRDMHPEFQPINVEAGYKSIHMKQLETIEELLRALIDIEITNLSKAKRAHMEHRYGHLI